MLDYYFPLIFAIGGVIITKRIAMQWQKYQEKYFQKLTRQLGLANVVRPNCQRT